MKWNQKNIIIGIFLAFFFLFSGIFLTKSEGTLERLEEIPLSIFGILALIVVIGLFLNGLFLSLVAKPFGIYIPRAFLLSCAASLLNMITPFRGGAVFRAWYLKSTLGMKYKDFVISLFGNYLIVFLTSSGVALCLLFFIQMKKTEFFFPLALFFSILFLGCISILLFPRPTLRKGFFAHKWNNVVQGWNLIRSSRLLVSELIVIALGNLLLEAIGIMVIFHGLRESIDAISALFIAAFLVVGIFINITPGSLGISESLTVFAGILLGISPEIILLGTLLRRGIGIITILFLGIPAKFLLLYSHSPLEKQEI
ncbi:flippase-like domain-containing protein [Candidatus Peregrinibacteria bacterium]|nr:MAG: flippase-like domain-containing protein [Candidatus Peregrinibacteria bacterium]